MSERTVLPSGTLAPFECSCCGAEWKTPLAWDEELPRTWISIVTFSHELRIPAENMYACEPKCAAVLLARLAEKYNALEPFDEKRVRP